MFGNKSLKFKIVISMIGLSLLTTILTSIVGVMKSSEIISAGAKDSFTLNAQNVTDEIYVQLGGVEKNVQLMSSLVAQAVPIKTQQDMQKLYNNQETAYSKIRIYPKTLTENTKWAQGGYFYFDQKYAPAYDGAWYAKENGVFKRNIFNEAINEEDGTTWYYAPIKQKKPVWSEPYVDSDLNIPMITYSMPVYKNGFLLGISGIDITLSELNKMLDGIKIYKNTEAFMIDNQFTFIAGKKFKVGENILNISRGKYNFLSTELAKNSSGCIQYKDGWTTKVLSYSKLPNGFILIIEVPLRDIPTRLMGTILTLLFLGVIIVLITGLLALKLGDYMAKPINSVVEGMSDYANELSNGANAYLALSQKLAEGSTEQASAIQEISSTLEESASIVAQNNENTKHAVVLAKTTKDSAVKGGREMEEVVDSMGKLKQSSKAIDKITAVISTIAFQTNLLALNAAVEAARAGDAGLGFAVVAEEVRNLAQKTAQATKDIGEIVKTNIDLSEACEQLTKKANESLSEINMQAQKVNELLNEISVSSNEQEIGISQITTAVNQIEQVVQTNAGNADVIAQSSEELLENVKNGINKIEQIVNGSL